MRYRSPFPNIEVPSIPLANFVFEHADSYPDKPAIVDVGSGTTLTYGALCRLVRSTAAGLAAKGFGKGDLLAVYTPPIPEYAVLFYGASLAGGAVTPLTPTQMVAELRYQLNDSGSRFLVTTPELLPVATRATSRTAVSHVFVVGEAAGATPLETLLGSPDNPPRVQICPEQDVVAVPYSRSDISGGLPLGVRLSHRNLVANTAQLSLVAPIARHEVVLTTPAPSQTFGLLMSMNLALQAGATIVIAPYLDLPVVLDTIERLSVTTAYLGTPLVRILARHSAVDQYDLSSLKHVVTTVTPFAERYLRECAARLGCTVQQAYGLTETCFVTHLTSRESAIDGIGAAGFGVPNTEFRIMDVEQRQEAAAGTVGEVWVRGPQVMLGYFNNLEATEAAFDADGWLQTGEIGYVAEDGCLYIEGIKDLVKRRSRRGDPDLEMFRPAIDHIATRRQLTTQVMFQSLLLDSVRESVVGLDDEYRVTFWNKGAEVLFGYSAQEAVGNTLVTLIVPDADKARAEWVAQADALRRAGTCKGPMLRRRKDGTVIWTDVIASVVTDADGQAAGFVALHRDITELRRHQDELRRSHGRLRKLASRLIEVREAERTALARELHDELGQVLTRLKIDFQWLSGRLPRYLRTDRTREMMRLVDHILDTTQHISSQLRPAILDDLGLEAALEWQAQEFLKWGPCRCELDLSLNELRSSRERDTTVFRIVQEALTNVARHSHATAVQVRGRIVDNMLEIGVYDDGIGFTPPKLASRDSLGLLGMRERAESIGGTVQFAGSSAGGTVVEIRVPLETQVSERVS